MDFQKKLNHAVTQKGIKSTLIEMGYLKPTERHLFRLNHVIFSETLGLTEDLFDLKYSNRNYVKKLAEICGFTVEETESVINVISEKSHSDKTAFKPYIFINTGFKRATQPIFALAACEHLRYLTLPSDLIFQPALEQLTFINERIEQHFEETNGFLGIWGNVISYFFAYDKGCAIEISPVGHIIANHNDFEPDSQASIEYKNKAIKLS